MKRILVACKRSRQHGQGITGCNSKFGSFSPYKFKGSIPTIFTEKDYILLLQLDPDLLGRVSEMSISISN